MNIVYLDQFVPNKIRRSETDSDLGAYCELGEVIRTVVNEGRAVFPFSDDHCAESGKLSDLSHRRWLDRFWGEVCGGYQYMAAEYLLGSQLEQVFKEQTVRFASHLGIVDQQIGFGQHLEDYDGEHNARVKSRMREVVQYWHSLQRKEIVDGVRYLETFAPLEIVRSMFAKIDEGRFPLLKEIQSKANFLFGQVLELLWVQRGSLPDVDGILGWLAQNLHKVPSIYLEACCLETLAEDYSLELGGNVDKSTLHTYLHDFAALSNYMPYSDAGMFDYAAVGKFTKAREKAGFRQLNVFSSRQIQDFIATLKLLPRPEVLPTWETEVCLSKRTLLFLPHRGNPLIKREALTEMDNISREILPYGGLKIGSDSAGWSALLDVLKQSSKEYQRESPTTAWIHPIFSGKSLWKELHDFGMWEFNKGLEERIEILP